MMKLKEVNGRREGSDCGTPRKVVSQKDAGSSENMNQRDNLKLMS